MSTNVLGFLIIIVIFSRMDKLSRSNTEIGYLCFPRTRMDRICKIKLHEWKNSTEFLSYTTRINNPNNQDLVRYIELSFSTVV